MKVGPRFSSFNMSSKGMSIYRKKMDLISENIAIISTTKTKAGKPYQKKFLKVIQNDSFTHATVNTIYGSISIRRNNSAHMALLRPDTSFNGLSPKESSDGLIVQVKHDRSEGNMEYIPDHPDADENGYVMMPNVNIVTEMVEMIAATRSYESNLTAFNAAKQMTKDSLEI